MCRAPAVEATVHSRLPTRVFIWQEAQRPCAECYIRARASTPEEIATVPIIVIKSRDWLNRHVAVGDVIYHSGY